MKRSALAEGLKAAAGQSMPAAATIRRRKTNAAQPATVLIGGHYAPEVRRTLLLVQAEPGVWRTTFEAKELGLWRASDGKLTALANVGPANPREFDEVTSTTDWVSPITSATGGDAVRIEDGAGIHLPRVVGVRANDSFHGDDWIGLKIREASVVRGIGVLPVFAGLIGLLLLVGSLAATWAREGR